MKNKSPQEVFEELTAGLPLFDDGRINFTGVRKAPVVNVVVSFKDEILIVKRSEKVSAYQGLWNGISGFIDEPKPIEEFAKQELKEELSLNAEVIQSIHICTPYEVNDYQLDRVWVVYPVLVSLTEKPAVVLDWENTDFAWVKPDELHNYQYVKDFDKSVTKALSAIDS